MYTTNGMDCQDSLETVRETYSQDVGETESIAQREQGTSIIDVINKVRRLSKPSLVYFSQVIISMRIFMPAITTVIEGSVSFYVKA